MSFDFSFPAYKNTPFPKQYTILSNKWGAVQNGAVLFLCGSFCFLFAVPPACADSSIPPYSSPVEDRFCPPYLCPQGRPAFPKMAACFAERSYYTRKKSIEIPLRPFILPFLTDFTMFFAKKALQMNFKNILYNYRFNFFTQIVSYRFV